MSGNRYVFAQAQNITITTTSDTTEYGTVKSLSGAFSVSGANSAVANAFLADTTATSIFGSNGPTITSTGYLSGTQTNSVSGGPYTITASGGTPVNGSTISFQNSGTLTIGQRSLTVTADAQSRAYGASNPALTYTVGGSGLVNGDTLTGALSTSATTASNVGSYAIGQNTLAASSNYALTYVSANLGVTPVTLTYTANAASMTYGSSMPGLSGTVTGFVNGETAATVTTGTLAFTTAASSTSNAGSYAITGSGLSANNGNYSFVQAAGNTSALTIGQRSLTVTADAQSRAYGASNPALTYTVGGSGLVNGDTLTGALSTSATTASNVGSYAIGQNTLAASSNYALTYVSANLGVTPVTLTYTANAASMTYGSSMPGLSGTVTGFVNGETAATVTTGTLAFTTAASSTSNAGSYAITGSGLSANNGNYSFVQAAGNTSALTIGQRSLTVTADAHSRAYGASNPALTYTVGGSGLVNGDTLTGALSTSATTASNVGSYTIGQDTLAASSNYALTYVSANLGVTPAPLTVTGTVVGSKIYDGSLAGGIVTVGTLSGFVGTETVTASGLATLSSPKVGTQMATVAYRLRDGTNGGLALNYSLVNSTGLSATVTARPFTASGTTGDAYLIALLNERLYALGVRIGFSTLLTSADLSQNAYSRAVKIADSTGTISNFSIAQIGREPVFIPFVTSIQKTPRIGAF